MEDHGGVSAARKEEVEIENYGMPSRTGSILIMPVA